MPSGAAATEDEGLKCREVKEWEVYEEGGLLDIYNNGEDAVEDHESQAEMPILVSLLVLDLDITICSLDCKFE